MFELSEGGIVRYLPKQDVRLAPGIGAIAVDLPPGAVVWSPPPLFTQEDIDRALAEMLPEKTATNTADTAECRCLSLINGHMPECPYPARTAGTGF